MILADKITALRKRERWSQEELAERLKVSRQSVSKWESAQSVPELEKILQLSRLFGVSTDYLLKDEIEEVENHDSADEPKARTVTLDEAREYLRIQHRSAFKIALATFLCILSPITLIVLGATSEIERFGISETFMGAVGLSALFGFIIAAVPIFIHCGFQSAPFEFLNEKEGFKLSHGVRESVSEHKRTFEGAYRRWNVIATCLCIFSPLPLIVTAFWENAMLSVLMLALGMIIAGVGAGAFITVGIQRGALDKLLSEGDYSREKKEKNSRTEALGTAYWSVIAAAFFVWGFIADAWHPAWIVFAVGGILFPAFLGVINALGGKDKN